MIPCRSERRDEAAVALGFVDHVHRAGEGLGERPADADLGSVLGVGFPPWTGGVLSHVDTVGPAAFVAACDMLADLYGDRFRPSDWLRERAARGARFHEGETS